MYDPATLAFSFPPYPKGGASFKGEPKSWSFGRWLYSLEPWLGVDVWHIDPERRGTGNRTDDSCGWFDRTPGEYADAVAYLLADTDTVHEIDRAIRTKASVTGPYGHTYPRLLMSEALALCLMVASELELRRWWNGQRGNGGAHASAWLKMFTRERIVMPIAVRLALNPIDNLSTPDSPEEVIGLIAAALNRHFRPWWKHPRWHIHHWQINLHIIRNVRRMFERCSTCGKPLGFGYCPTQSGGALHHGECLGHGVAAAEREGTAHA